MYINIYMYTYIYQGLTCMVYIQVYTFYTLYTHTSIYICTYIYMCVYMSINVCVYMYILYTYIDSPLYIYIRDMSLYTRTSQLPTYLYYTKIHYISFDLAEEPEEPEETLPESSLHSCM